MATGDQADILRRIHQILPPWFPAGASPNLDAVLGSATYAGSFVYGLIQFTRAQARLSTASGGWVDMTGYDYFQRSFVRPTGWTDAQYVAAIKQRLLNPNGTRPGMVSGVTALTGRAPTICEPWNPGDTMCWDTPQTGGWDVGPGRWADVVYNNQVFIIAYRSNTGGVANVGGWDTVQAGWDTPAAWEWADSLAVGQVTDAQIYATIASLMPAGTIAWVAISS